MLVFPYKLQFLKPYKVLKDLPSSFISLDRHIIPDREIRFWWFKLELGLKSGLGLMKGSGFQFGTQVRCLLCSGLRQW